MALSPEMASACDSEEQGQLAMESTLPLGSGFHLAAVSASEGSGRMATLLSSPTIQDMHILEYQEVVSHKSLISEGVPSRLKILQQ